jgi:rubrerythrin
MLSGQGFQKVYNLAGGIKAWQGATVEGPAEVGMGLITGNETPDEMLGVVFGMEEGMRSFYERLAERVESPDVAALCRKLSAIEVEHKNMLFDLYRKHGGEAASVEDLEKTISADAAENGMTSEELIEAYHPRMRSREDVLILAMMLEAQALDLYLRYARRSETEDTTAVLHELADQEKAHLAALGELMESAS